MFIVLVISPLWKAELVLAERQSRIVDACQNMINAMRQSSSFDHECDDLRR